MSKRPQSAENGYSSLDENSDFLPLIQGINRCNLEDDGTRDWQGQAEALLDNNYPDWKDPESTYMVPAAFPSHKKLDKGLLCEKDVYDLLQDFGETYKEPMFVVHSHNFKERIDSVKSGDSNKWVIGEHDFLIIHRSYGPIFLQVKASDEKDRLKAFNVAQKQIEKDKKSLKYFLNNQFVKGKSKRKLPNTMFDYPGFVVMPNCRRTPPTSVPHSNAVFLEDCMDLESFRSWWEQNVVKDERVDADIYQELLVRFVALVHSGPPLNMQIEQSHNQIVFYTKQQLKVLVESPPKLWITGPAGSGKTVLLIEKVERLAKTIIAERSGERILVLAFNIPLREYLCKKLKEPYGDITIDVLTYSQFLLQKGIVTENHFADDLSYRDKCYEVDNFYANDRVQPPVELQYEHIFIDEGQDLYGKHWYELLMCFHNKPDPDGEFYFWVMYDSNQHVQPAENRPPMRYLQDAHKLTRVLRNTQNIFKLSKKYFTSVYKRISEIQLDHSEVGLNVKWVNELRPDKNNGSSLLIKTIVELQKQSVQTSDIVVLTRNKDESFKLRQNLRGLGCQTATAEQRIKFKNPNVTVESIRRFKGLESKVVILYNPEYVLYPGGNNQARELMYVAVSRCKCFLIIISTEDGCEWLKSEKGLRI